ncbi:hypothetical protein Kpol_1014p30 [Vanderwaltozyma polyspora DSM 70294]|uniref:Uncharacterized protein n=1 Tax=Vanderwaltozyma polyspora (strain ATCC 22028 / DSM 70294 / BCRC 21397 / CBS 2163 / NBRC 10782 / NRRL Y-8283 / UCD 57-17) TaxID=436907 RepID=A7TNF7_VANPO|nr:uncharacterized protein Kpol_1014p30 [Vanderwaltozyma polyspora DSM 70294]EDO16210.1 hypothetical protein Kpol_1014p30 [Vanderwaltozyma polyspora DSM 70294]
MVSIQSCLLNFITLASAVSAADAFFSNIQVVVPDTLSSNCTYPDGWFLIEAELFAAKGKKDNIYFQVPKEFTSFPEGSFDLTYKSSVIGTVSHSDNLFNVTFIDEDRANLTTTFNFLARLTDDALGAITEPMSIEYDFQDSTGESFANTINYMPQNVSEINSYGGIYQENNTAWFILDIPASELSNGLYFESVPTDEDAYLYDEGKTVVEIVTEVDSFNQPLKSIPYLFTDLSTSSEISLVLTNSVTEGYYLRIKFYSQQITGTSITNLITLKGEQEGSLLKRDTSLTFGSLFYGDSLAAVTEDEVPVQLNDVIVSYANSSSPIQSSTVYVSSSINEETTLLESESLTASTSTSEEIVTSSANSEYDSSIEEVPSSTSSYSESEVSTSSSDLESSIPVETELTSIQSTLSGSISVPTQRNRTSSSVISTSLFEISSTIEVFHSSSYSQCSSFSYIYTTALSTSKTNNIAGIGKSTTSSSNSTTVASSTEIAPSAKITSSTENTSSAEISSSTEIASSSVPMTSSAISTTTPIAVETESSVSQSVPSTSSSNSTAILTSTVVTVTIDGQVTSYTSWFPISTVQPTKPLELQTATIVNNSTITKTISTPHQTVTNNVDAELTFSVVTITVDGQLTSFTSWFPVATVSSSNTTTAIVNSISSTNSTTRDLETTTTTTITDSQISSHTSIPSYNSTTTEEEVQLTYSVVTVTKDGQITSYTSWFPCSTKKTSTSEESTPTSTFTVFKPTATEAVSSVDSVDLTFSIVTVTIDGQVTSYTSWFPISTISPTVSKTEDAEMTSKVVTVTVSGKITSYTTYCPISELSSTKKISSTEQTDIISTIVTNNVDAEYKTHTTYYPLYNITTNSTTTSTAHITETTKLNSKISTSSYAPIYSINNITKSTYVTTRHISVEASLDEFVSIIGHSSLTTNTVMSNSTTTPVLSTYEGIANTFKAGFTGLTVVILALLF